MTCASMAVIGFCCAANTDHGHDGDDGTLRLLHWQHLVDRDPSLEDMIPVLEVDYSAERRAVGAEWRMFLGPDTDD